MQVSLLADFVATTLASLGPFEPTPHIAVAVSGGADSLALTLLADHWARALGGRITALTIDHGLRAESRQEAEQVADWLGARTIAHQILTPPHHADSNNLQESARQWRYDALAQWCQANDVLHCLIAHHAGDLRETVALHTARGETEDGPSGMAMLRNYRHVRFLRPLLGVEKQSLIAYLTAQSQPWIEDPSNQNLTFARVRVRRQLADDPEQAQTLLTHAIGAGAARAARDEELAEAAITCATLSPEGEAELLLAPWRALPEALATQLLADLLRTVARSTQRPRASDTKRLADALRTAPKRRTLHGCLLTPHGDRLRITREHARLEMPEIVTSFTPPKPLAAAPFWWLKESSVTNHLS